MTRSALWILLLLPLLLLPPLLGSPGPLALAEAPPNAAAGPAVGASPTPLYLDPEGQVLAMLESGTPLTLHTASCEQNLTWVDVTAGDRTGWVAADEVDFGAGVPLALQPWTRSLEVRDQPLGNVQAIVTDRTAFSAIGVGCGEHRTWIRVSLANVEGWVPGHAVLFRDRGALAAARAGTPSPAPPRPAMPYRANSPEYGMHVFAWGHPQAPALLGQVRDLHFAWQKSLIRWRDVEGAGKWRYDWSSTDALIQASTQHGLKVLARVDFQPAWARADGADNGPPDDYRHYGDFVQALVTRYGSGSPHGRIHAIEVWNEPNLSKTWGDQPINAHQAADYVRFLSVAYQAVKAVDPSVMVISASLTATGTNTSRARADDLYLQWLYDAGLRDYSDALGAHAPGYKAPPEISPAEAARDPYWGGDRSFTFRRVEDLRAVMVRNGDADKQIWVTEFGWTSDPVNPDYSWCRVTESQKGDYLVRALGWAQARWSPWIGPMMVWTMPDPTWEPHDEKYWWAIAEPDGTPRPAYLALREARQSGVLP